MASLFLVVGFLVWVPADIDLLNRAQELFHEGVKQGVGNATGRTALAQAAACYETLWAKGFHNQAVSINEGNAHYLAGDKAKAIAAFRRGLELDPFNNELQTNLSIARRQVASNHPDQMARIPDGAWEQRWWTSPFGMGISFCAHVVFWVALARWWVGRNPWWWLAGSAGLLVAVIGFASCVSHLREYTGGDAYPWIVVARDGVNLREGNGIPYPPSSPAPLYQGVEARRLFIRGEWLQIELASGEVGWIPREDVLTEQLPGEGHY